MLYFVDGSNLLGAQHSLETPGAATALLAVMDRFCRACGNSARVVFDGMDGHVPGEMIRFSECITAEIPPYDGDRDRADRLLILRLSAIRDTDSVRLVTDDRELSRRASEHGIRTESCTGFLRRMRKIDESGSRHIEDEKERAASSIDNTEFLRLWTQPEQETTEP